MGDEMRERVARALAELFMQHWPTPTSGCQCGGVGLGEAYPHHIADAALDAIDLDTVRDEGRREAAEGIAAAQQAEAARLTDKAKGHDDPLMQVSHGWYEAARCAREHDHGAPKKRGEGQG